jgi:hypothetical protein
MAAVAIPVGIGMMGWHFVAFSYLHWGFVLPACVLLALGLMFHQLDAFERSALAHLYRQILKKVKWSTA